jgi:hypothetical protein
MERTGVCQSGRPPFRMSSFFVHPVLIEGIGEYSLHDHSDKKINIVIIEVASDATVAIACYRSPH